MKDIKLNPGIYTKLGFHLTKNKSGFLFLMLTCYNYNSVIGTIPDITKEDIDILMKDLKNIKKEIPLKFKRGQEI